MTTERTHDDASQHVPEVRNRPGVGGWMRQIGWGALALFLAAFAVFESVKYGLPTTAAMLGFFALPDLARLAGVRPPGPLYHVVHRVWVPLAIAVGYSIGPIVWPPLFTAGLGWLTRIAVERAFGRGLSQRGRTTRLFVWGGSAVTPGREDDDADASSPFSLGL